MKYILTPLLSFFTFISFAQIAVTPNQTAADLANSLVATSSTSGVTISNSTLTCDTLANGLISGMNITGIGNGIALGSGTVGTANIPVFGEMSTYIGSAGDADLDAIVSMPTYDACVLEFDLVPVGNYVEFEYVFGSVEYPEFNCSSFNDVFAFFISGSGITNADNMALIPNTTTPVSINSINDGTGGTCSAYQNLYITNTDTSIKMDGYTVPLIATHPVTPGATYHLKLAVSDVADGILNTYVLLKANSLKSGNTAPTSVSDLTQNGIKVYPTEVTDILTIENRNSQSWNVQIINIEGKICYRTTIGSSDTKATLHLNSLSKGVYIVKMENASSGKILTNKFIKE